jgi:hypothetical protein
MCITFRRPIKTENWARETGGHVRPEADSSTAARMLFDDPRPRGRSLYGCNPHIVVLRHKRRPLNRHPEALGAPLCAPSHRKSATADLRILIPTSGKPEVGG